MKIQTAWWHNLRFRIPVAFLLMIVAVGAVTSYVLSDVANPLLERHAKGLLNQAGEKVVEELEERIAATEALASALARVGESLPNEIPLIKRVIPSIIDLPGSENYVAGGGIWPQAYQFDEKIERRSFFWGRDSEGKLNYYDNYNDAEGAGYHHEEWYVPAIYQFPGEYYWSKSYMDPYSMQPMVTCTAAMYKGGVFYGVSTIDLKLEGLGQLLKESAEKMQGYVFALDRDGRFLSYPDEQLVRIGKLGDVDNASFVTISELAEEQTVFQPYAQMHKAYVQRIIKNGGKKRAQIDALGDTIAQSSYQINPKEGRLIAATLHASSNKRVVNYQFTQQSIEFDPYLKESAIAAQFEVPGSNWHVIAVIPQSVIVQANRSVYYTLAIAIISTSIIFILITFMFFHRVLIGPLNHIIDQLSKMGESDMDKPGLINVRGEGELYLLVYWFNRYSKRLNRALEDLRDTKSDLESNCGELEQARNELAHHRDNLQLTIEERTHDLRRAIEEVESASRAKSEFLANMSHELRTPLHAIISFSHLGMKKLGQVPSEKIESYFDRIHSSGNRLLLLLDDLLDLAKLETGKMDLHVEQLELVATVEACVSDMEANFLEQNLTVNIIEPDYAVLGYFDPDRISQVILNLLSNAIKFSPKGGIIDIELEILSHRFDAEGDTVNVMSLTVSDQGTGISDEELEAIFDKFVQGSRTKTGAGGTGLGLAICREIVELHHGEIFALNRTIGGAKFVCLIPTEPRPIYSW